MIIVLIQSEATASICGQFVRLLFKSDFESRKDSLQVKFNPVKIFLNFGTGWKMP